MNGKKMMKNQEPNRAFLDQVQAKFPDIRGFPTLKFLPSNNPKKAIDYNGAREDDAIVAFAKEQAKAESNGSHEAGAAKVSS
mgnify:CR=1 FL=1